jgi:hypothetical protein
LASLTSGPEAEPVQTSKTARETGALTRESTNDERGSERVLLHSAMFAPGRIRHPTRSPARLWCTLASLPDISSPAREQLCCAAHQGGTCTGTDHSIRPPPRRTVSPASWSGGHVHRLPHRHRHHPHAPSPDADSALQSGIRQITVSLRHRQEPRPPSYCLRARVAAPRPVPRTLADRFSATSGTTPPESRPGAGRLPPLGHEPAQARLATAI